MKLRSSRFLAPLIPMIVVVALAECVVRLGLIPEFLLPAPSSVLASMVKDRSELLGAGLETALGSVVGLAMSFVVGSAFALLISTSRLLQRAVQPYAVIFQTVPVIAIAPLLVIWFGFGLPTVIASAFIVSIFPIIASTSLGLQSTDPALIDLFRLYSASRLQLLFRLRVPFALPHVFSGLRIASGLAVIGAIVGEFIGGGGLGSLIDAARQLQRTDQIFAAVFISSALGLVLVGLINLLAWLALRRWHASAQNH